MISGRKVFPYLVAYGDPATLLNPSVQNTREGESILFGKNRLLNMMEKKEVEGLKVVFVKSKSDSYPGIQVMFVGVDRWGKELLDIENIEDEEALDEYHVSIMGIGHTRPPDPELFTICCIDWEYIYLLIRIALLENEELSPDAGCPDCGPWDDGYYFP